MPQQAEVHNNTLLSEEDIKCSVLSHYGLQKGEISQIKFKDTDKQRAVYRIDYEGHSYCLKKVYYQEPDLRFVYSAIEWLHRSGINVPRILPTLSRGRYVEYNSMLFILTPWVDGSKCSYDNMEHVMEASRVLANIHKCTENFTPISGSTEKKGLEDMEISLQKHFQQMLNCSNLAFKYKDHFSKLFLQHFETSLYLGQYALQVSSTMDINRLSKSLCHLDFVNKNIIIDKENRFWIIDFDKCKIDYCIHDISYFLRRIMKRDNTKWDLQLAIDSLKMYEKTRPITLDEYKYLLIYLSFPQKYWKISRDYYNNIRKCNKNSFITLLNKAVEKNEYQIQFVQEFRTYIEDKFSAYIT